MITNIHSGEQWNIQIPKETEFYNHTDKEYKKVLIEILKNGKWKQNRTGVKTLSMFQHTMKFPDVGTFFPLLSLKKVHYKAVLGELLWFLEGNTNKFYLKEKYGTSIWAEWGDDKTGELGPIYGSQWVNWNNEGINQLQNIIDTLRTNPDDRRMIVSAWNPGKLSQQALPPCHWGYQFYSEEIGNKRKLNLAFFMRSLDIFLGGPFDIASYATLLMMVAQQTNHEPGDLYLNSGDTHIYEDHIPYVKEILERKTKDIEPELKINKKESLWKYTPEDFNLTNYNTHPNWKNVPIAI